MKLTPEIHDQQSSVLITSTKFAERNQSKENGRKRKSKFMKDENATKIVQSPY